MTFREMKAIRLEENPKDNGNLKEITELLADRELSQFPVILKISQFEACVLENLLSENTDIEWCTPEYSIIKIILDDIKKQSKYYENGFWYDSMDDLHNKVNGIAAIENQGGK